MLSLFWPYILPSYSNFLCNPAQNVLSNRTLNLHSKITGEFMMFTFKKANWKSWSVFFAMPHPVNSGLKDFYGFATNYDWVEWTQSNGDLFLSIFHSLCLCKKFHQCSCIRPVAGVFSRCIVHALELMERKCPIISGKDLISTTTTLVLGMIVWMLKLPFLVTVPLSENSSDWFKVHITSNRQPATISL